MTDNRVAAFEARVCDAIDDHVDKIIDFMKDVQTELELGYKEMKTTEKVVSLLKNLGLDVETELAITGARAYAGSGDFVAAILGELDVLVNPGHPMVDLEIGAVHTCGHSTQLADLAGTTFDLVGSGIVDDLDGTVEFVVVLAEEHLDLDYQRGLFGAGDIEFLGGRQEPIRRGYVDDQDAAVMMYAGSDTPERTITDDSSTNDFIGKFVTYHGTETHVGATPEEGVNVLNVAMFGMSAIHAQHKRFCGEDHVRVHPIIARGGDGVNVASAEVATESYVRAASVEVTMDVNKSTNRAPASSAMGVSGNVEIEDYPDYMPPRTDETIVTFYDENARDIIGPGAVTPRTPHLSGLTDTDDITQLAPGIRPWTGDFKGTVYACDSRIADEEMAYVIPARLTACALVDLLTGPGAVATIRETKAEKHSRGEYLDAVRSLQTMTTKSRRDRDVSDGDSALELFSCVSHFR